LTCCLPCGQINRAACSLGTHVCSFRQGGSNHHCHSNHRIDQTHLCQKSNHLGHRNLKDMKYLKVNTLLVWQNIEVHFIVEATFNLLKGFWHSRGLRLLLLVLLILGLALSVSVASLLFLNWRFVNCSCSYFNFNSFPFLLLILISFLILLLDYSVFNSLAFLN
jgi:hypothetical protein